MLYVVESRFQDLRRRKAFEEKRDLPLRTIAEETGLALATVHKLSTGNIDGIRISTVNVLCKYFDVASIADLIEYRKN